MTAPVDYTYDPAVARRVLGRGPRRAVLWSVLGVIAVGGGVASLIAHMTGLLTVLCAVVLLVCAMAAPLSWLGYTNSRDAFGRLTGTLVRVTDAGLDLDTLPGLRWEEILQLSVFDRRNQIAALRSNRARQRLMDDAVQSQLESSGAGTVSLAIVVADAASARSRVVGAPGAHVVAEGTAHPGAVRRGYLLFTPDTLLPISSVEHLVHTLAERAEEHGIPFTVTTNSTEFRTAISEVRDAAPIGPAGA